MNFDVTIWSALIAGLLSFLTPCVLPIVLPSLGFLAGASLGEMTGEESSVRARLKVMGPALAFVLGFTVMFMAIGAAASAIGGAVADYKPVLQRVAGLLLIVMGLHFTGLVRIPLLYRQARFEPNARPASYAGAFLVGLAFAFGWTPCAGPTLSPILFLAADSGSMSDGVTLLFAYALGMGVPFLVAAAFAPYFLRFVRASRPLLHRVELVIGVLLIATGGLFMTERGMTVVSGWIEQAAPEFWLNML